MQVALYRTNADLARCLYAAFSQQGLKQGSAHIHRAGSHQNLRNENLVLFEPVADNIHPGKQALLQNVLRGNAFINSLLNQLLDDLCFPSLQILRNFT